MWVYAGGFEVCVTLARERTIGLSMMPLRKIRSISLAPVPDGRSFKLSSTCCMTERKKHSSKIELTQGQPLFGSLELEILLRECKLKWKQQTQPVVMNMITILDQWKHWLKKHDNNKSLQGNNNKGTVNQWANSLRKSLISIAAATSTQSHKGIVLVTNLPCSGWKHSRKNEPDKLVVCLISQLNTQKELEYSNN